MKKAKLLLSGIALIAIVGGAVAFKTRSAVKIFYRTTPTGPCTNELLIDRTVIPPQQFDGSILGATVAEEPPATCPDVIYYIND